LDTQKKKINTLENELSKESLKSFELSQELEEKSASVQLLNVEIKDLRKQLELPVLPTVATTPLSSGTDMFKLGMEQTDSESLMEAFTPELKDKMYRLEKENELMKRKITSMENTSDKSQPADSHEAAQLDELRKELAEKSVQVEHLQQSLARRNRDLDQLSDARTTFDQLRAQMKAKDAEIEKLKKYLNKAKKIIESFGEKKSDPAAESAQVQQLSNRLVQRDREVEKLEKTLEQQRADREKEERLILSAWYNLGLQFHQLHSKDRLQAQASFLAHQRQALMRKPAGMNTTNTNTGSSSFTLS
jgi:chromosome segregation ATPase